MNSTEDEDRVYKVVKSDLDSLISSILDQDESDCKPENDVTVLQTQVKQIERKQREINKIFLDCQDQLDKFREALRLEEEEEEQKQKDAEKAVAEAEETDRKQKLKEEQEAAEVLNLIDDSDDDDIEIIGSSFDPSHVANRKTPIKGQLANTSKSSRGVEIVTVAPTSAQQSLIASTAAGGQVSVAHLRAILTDVINKQMPGTQAYAQSQNQLQQLQQQNVSSIQIQSALQKQLASSTVTPQTRPSAFIPKCSGSSATDWKELEAGGKVLAKKFNDIWYSGTIQDITSKTDPPDQRKYKVKFDGKGMKVLSGKHIAYRDSIHVALKVGSRCVALYRDDEANGPNSFYAGIVAEAPSIKNSKRYLIFFDDGYAQYCYPKEIHKVYHQSVNVWEDIHPDSQEFIKEYLKQYPERPMVRLLRGQVVRTEWNGKWWTAKVMEVDASLVKMFFQADKRTESIYRGSTRLEPLFKALANAEAIKAAGSKARRHHNPADPKASKKPLVEYTRGLSEDNTNKLKAAAATPKPPAPTLGQGINQDHPAVQAYLQAREAGTQQAQKQIVEQKKRPVAKKSTGGKPSASSTTTTTTTTASSTSTWEAPWLKLPKRTNTGSSDSKSPSGDSDSRKSIYQASSISSNKVAVDIASVLQERLLKVDEEIVDEEALGERMDTMLDIKEKIRKKFIPHSCGVQCNKDTDEDLEKLKGRNVLLKPLLLGWERHVCKMRPGGRRVVMYQAPCRRRLRSIEEVDQYLLITDSPLTIDLFCFDPVLHTHTEFVPVKTFCDIKDLSYGKEAVPISCINGIDRQYPDYVEYSNQRIPAQGVKLNLNSEFLNCCDCTDNCRDKSKCSCCQLTVENTAALGASYRDPTAGYDFRRLKEPIFTGIFECNPKCKCDQRCQNRLAQNGLSLRLQVFKTEKKGWGLRCLDDIPKGGFICIYAGQLLTEGGANEDGKQYGDEYLAELDFIEVVERQKEGYESDVEEDQGFQDDDEDEDANISSNSSDSDFAGEGRNRNVEHKEHATRKKHRNSMSDMEKQSSVESADGTNKKDERSEKKTAEWVDSLGTNTIVLDDDDDNDDNKEKDMDIDELPDLDEPVEKKPEVQKPAVKESDEAAVKTKTETVVKVEAVGQQVDRKENKLLGRARKSTGGSRFKNLPNPRAMLGGGGSKTSESDTKVAETNGHERESAEQRPPTRTYFRDGQTCYIMDAKSMGNIGRYLNHSCTPNVFVQNVFVDTQDLRFPWVSFFALQYIRAGTELTWDYNYEVGSVPDKVLYCYCGSSQCRGRLL